MSKNLPSLERFLQELTGETAPELFAGDIKLCRASLKHRIVSLLQNGDPPMALVRVLRELLHETEPPPSLETLLSVLLYLEQQVTIYVDSTTPCMTKGILRTRLLEDPLED